MRPFCLFVLYMSVGVLALSTFASAAREHVIVSDAHELDDGPANHLPAVWSLSRRTSPEEDRQYGAAESVFSKLKSSLARFLVYVMEFFMSLQSKRRVYDEESETIRRVTNAILQAKDHRHVTSYYEKLAVSLFSSRLLSDEIKALAKTVADPYFVAYNTYRAEYTWRDLATLISLAQGSKSSVAKKHAAGLELAQFRSWFEDGLDYSHVIQKFAGSPEDILLYRQADADRIVKAYQDYTTRKMLPQYS